MVKFLTCYKCRINAIPAPEGAIEQTKYICARCSPLVIPEESQLDRCAFNGFTKSHVPGNARPEYYKLLLEDCNRLFAIVPFDVQRARQRGETWVKHATMANMKALPRALALSLLMTMWGGLTSKEAGELLGIESQTVRHNCMMAKKRLAYCNGNINKLRDKRKANHR